MELIGWLGSIALALCAFPAAIKVYQEKHAYYLSGASIALWYVGEWLTFIYLLGGTKSLSWPLIANYIANIVLVSIIVYYKLWPTHTEGPQLKVVRK